MSRVVFTASLNGDAWKIAAPLDSEAVHSPKWPHRVKAIIPGVLQPLSVWELIEAAREGLYGLRVLGHSVNGTSTYIWCLWDEVPTPLRFAEAST